MRNKPTITIYTNPKCVQCDQTKRYLDNNQVEYNTVDLSTNQEALDMVLGMGYKSAPIVITDTSHWSGYRHEQLKDLVQRVKRETHE